MILLKRLDWENREEGKQKKEKLFEVLDIFKNRRNAIKILYLSFLDVHWIKQSQL